MVYPGKPLTEDIIRLTGITDKDLKDAPYAEEVLPQLLDFLGDDPVCAQNAPFDITFLKVEFARTGMPFRPNESIAQAAIDTAVLSRALMPELESHGLSRLAEFFNISGGVAHRAEDDARRCGYVLLKIVRKMKELSASECISAGKILGQGIMGDIFRNLAKALTQALISAEAVPERRGYSHNKLGSVDPDEEVDSISEEMEKIFGRGGLLATNMKNYEPRYKQREMAEDCAESLFSGNYLMAEAGTGTGKSFAYLIPAILFSISEKNRIIISTNTKNLQEQLFSKDIPFLIDILPYKFQAALLKGRGNYICLRKWYEVLTDPDYLLAEDERTRVLTLLFWVNRTTTGDISENNGFKPGLSGYTWNKFASEAGSCGGQKCSRYDKCFLQKAREQAGKSHLIVVNHSLVLSDIAADNAVLGEYNYLVVDEAHNLEKAASNHLGKDMNIYKLRAYCHKLYRKDRIETGLLVRLKKYYAGGSNDLADQIEAAIFLSETLRSHAGEFFGRIAETARLQHSGASMNYTLKKRYFKNDTCLNAGMTVFEDLADCIEKLEKTLRNISGKLAEMGEDVTETGAPGLETASAADEAQRISDYMHDLTEAADHEWVYWWELPSKENAEVSLYSAPLNPGKILNEHMYPWLDSVIFTSATLTIADTFDYFRNRLGLDIIENKTVITKNYGSPFDYRNQAVFGVPAFMPWPKNQVEFTDALSNLVIELASHTHRGMLVLFTSYQQLNVVYNAVKNTLNKEGIELLGQGIDGSRSDLLKRFLNERSVLLGTDSFWEGIDAPGEALEILVVVKLPFDVPTEPIVQARTEKLESEGKNPFLEYSIPEAAVKLRQGVGRLIRSNTDRGAVIVCDVRMINSRWGKVFRDSLPGKVEVFGSIPDIIGALSEVIGE